MTWQHPPRNFHYVLLEKMQPQPNQERFYLVGWQPTLFDGGAVVRLYGRKSGFQRTITPRPFESLTDAWPFIRQIIKTRLRHGYQVVRRAPWLQ